MLFGVIFDFLKYLKISFLEFFNSNYISFTELSWFEASLYDFFNVLNFLVLCVFGVIFDFLKFLRMSFLIFLIITIAYLLNFFYLKPPYMTLIFLELLDLWSFGEIFEFLKMSFLIFLNYDYSLFSETFCLKYLYIIL